MDAATDKGRVLIIDDQRNMRTTLALMLRLAGRIYAHTLLHRGARLRWRQALRSAASDRPG